MSTGPPIRISDYSQFFFKIFSSVFKHLVWNKCETINKNPTSHVRNFYNSIEISVLNAFIATFFKMPKTVQNDNNIDEIRLMQAKVCSWKGGNIPLFCDSLITTLMSFDFDITSISIRDFSINCRLLTQGSRCPNTDNLVDFLTDGLRMMRKVYFIERLFDSVHIRDFLTTNYTTFHLKKNNRIGIRIKEMFERMYSGLTILCEPPVPDYDREALLLLTEAFSKNIPDTSPVVGPVLSLTSDIVASSPAHITTPAPTHSPEIVPVLISTTVQEVTISSAPGSSAEVSGQPKRDITEDAADPNVKTFNFKVKRGRLCLGDDEIVFRIEKFRRMIVTKKESGEISLECMV